MLKTKARTGVFYGYIIVLTSLLILVVMHGINTTFGVFFSQLQNQFGWDRARISVGSSLAFFLTGAFSIASGKLTDRYGPKFTMTASCLLLGAGYFMMSRMNSLWQLYVFYGLIVAMGNSGGDIALLPTTARWFVRGRTFMSACVKVGTGIGIFVVPLIAAWLIVNYGWRTAYEVLGIAAFVLIFAFSRFLKKEPSEMGLEPYGAHDAAATKKATAGVNLTLREVLRTWQFWTISISYFFVWFSTQSIMVHIAPHAVDTGFSVSQAAGIVSIIGGASIAGRLTIGWGGDRLGNRKAIIACFFVLLVALSWLQFASARWMLYAFAPVYGFAHGGFFSVLSPFVAELFGTKSHGSNLGMLFFVGMSGGAVGPIFTGHLYDITHDYHAAFLMLLLSGAAGLTLAAVLKPVRGNRIAKSSSPA